MIRCIENIPDFVRFRSRDGKDVEGFVLTSEDIKKHTDDFLAAGNKIQQIEMGKIGASQVIDRAGEFRRRQRLRND